MVQTCYGFHLTNGSCPAVVDGYCRWYELQAMFGWNKNPLSGAFLRVSKDGLTEELSSFAASALVVVSVVSLQIVGLMRLPGKTQPRWTGIMWVATSPIFWGIYDICVCMRCVITFSSGWLKSHWFTIQGGGFKHFCWPLGKIPMLIYMFQVGWLNQHRCWCTSRPRSFRFCTWCILVATRLSNIAPFPSWWCWYWDQLECRRWGYGDQITGWFHWVGVEINYWSGHHWSKVSTKQPSRSCPYQLSQQNQDFGNHLNRWLWRSGWVASAQIWLPCHLKLLAGSNLHAW